MSSLAEEPPLINVIEVYPPLPYPRRDLPVGGRLVHFARAEKITGPFCRKARLQDTFPQETDLFFLTPRFFKQSKNPVLEEDIQKLFRKRAVESIIPEDPGFYSRIFLVLKKNGKWQHSN